MQAASPDLLSPVSFHSQIAFSVMEPALVEAGLVLGAGEALFSESSQSSRGGKLVEPTPRPRVEGAKLRNEPHVISWQWEGG